MEPPGQIGPGNDMDMIKSYGGSGENQQSSTMEGGNGLEFSLKSGQIECSIVLGGVSLNTVPSDQVNTNPETDLYVESLLLRLFILCVFSLIENQIQVNLQNDL
jgi:hypothetical protein